MKIKFVFLEFFPKSQFNSSILKVENSKYVVQKFEVKKIQSKKNLIKQGTKNMFSSH